MKNRHSGFAEFLAQSKELEKQLLRDNGPAVCQSHTPHETLMGYRIGEEVFEDLALETETHPSGYVRVSELSDEGVSAFYADDPEDAYIRMIDHLSLPLASAVEAAIMPDDVEALVTRFQDRIERDEGETVAAGQPAPTHDPVDDIEKALFAAYVASLATAKKRRDERRHVRGIRASHGKRI